MISIRSMIAATLLSRTPGKVMILLSVPLTTIPYLIMLKIYVWASAALLQLVMMQIIFLPAMMAITALRAVLVMI